MALPALVDFQEQLVTFFSPGAITPADLKGCGMSDAVMIPLDDPQGQYQFTCRLRLTNGSHEAEEVVHVETGGRLTVISKQTADRLKLQPSEPSSNHSTLTGDLTLDEAPVDKVSLGDTSYNQPIMISYPHGEFLPSTGPQLGLDVLVHFQILLDYAEKRMYIKPVPAVESTAPAKIS